MSDKKVILVVEDEDAIRLTLRDYLVNKGYGVFVASDGVGAIKQLIDHHIDLIVTDYRMDTLGGDYWIKFLKKYCSELKIFITSGFLRPEFPIPFEVLYKPFDYSELESMISRALADPSGNG
jgi:DNA-binding NtrC family response regulator